MSTEGFIYILTNKSKRVLYVGVTSDLRSRIWEHYNKVYEGFTRRYKIKFLIYYEFHETIEGAIEREKEIKGWKRDRKFSLVKEKNKELLFLNDEISDDVYSLIED
ncbi:GIY-YIG nuclease family protein [Pedobacter flavus]|uniref:GIY-YIG nuclease family protein n=1 Tax=Pedobacter flavus TaxID=3113906 RepID=A0ABU7H1Z6_9SPHI|nr:GIY-YIG nuclease family protein [Pedobacter sp. VNH31]MEE1885053.1 GIY-YIG nuclease family protein [Pedobacter sp. VNH31]